MKPTSIRCGALFDGHTVTEGATIAVDGVRIESVGTAPPGDDELDLSAFTVLPGLIDAHDHIGFDVGDLRAQYDEGPGGMAVRATRNAADALLCGITTLRDLGEVLGLGVLWRDMLARGETPGPRLVVAREWITRTGGHGWHASRETDGVDDMRTAVREQARGGADWVKIMVTGGVMTPRSTPTAPGYTEAEIRAAVDEAHFLGLPISAHAIGGPALTNCIEAGIDSVEHAYYALDSDFDMMAGKGIPLVSTFGILDTGARSTTLAPEIVAKARSARDTCVETLARAREKGVTVTVGRDLHHVPLTTEIRGLEEAGFTRFEALQACTRTAAEVCRVPDVGTLEPGKRADLIAVEGDPFTDLDALRRVRVVVQDGVVRVRDGAIVNDVRERA
jgi:imidazolonepropionase-like amidohydrolase